MIYQSNYESPVGTILLLSDGKNITHVLLAGQTNDNGLRKMAKKEDLPIFAKTKEWLDAYFKGKVNPLPNLSFHGTTFQEEVWNILLTIPFGQVRTYGEIASEIACRRKVKRISAQAVGHAVSKNPISILIPCHRVIGKNQQLVGYQGGVLLKKELLKRENIFVKE